MIQFIEPDKLLGPRGRQVKLRWQEAVMVRRLLASAPAEVSHEQMARVLYDKLHRPRPATWRRCIYMLAASVRRAARTAGMPQPSRWLVTTDGGYRVEEPKP